MSLRPADLRFLVGHEVRSATVLADPSTPALDAAAQALARAGVALHEPGGDAVDLVLAAAAMAARALAHPARSHLLLGRPQRRHLRGRTAQELVVLGPLTRPIFVVPAGSRLALTHYLTSLASPPGRPGRVRNRGLATLARSPLPVSRILPARRLVTLVTVDASTPVPRLLARSGATGAVAPTGDWVLGLGQGDDLQRAVFHVLAEPARRVVKFRRVPGSADAFDRDEAGLTLARDAGLSGVGSGHAPLLLARFESDGLPGSVEEAAPGRPLIEVLGSRPLPVIDAIAGWVVEVGRSTAGPPSELDSERRRLTEDVLPRWSAIGVPQDLVDRVPPVPGVLAHHDLGSWNIITEGAGFTVVDWESARKPGLPLWDLLYFLGDVLARLPGPAAPDELLARCIALFTGRAQESPLLFGWVRDAVRRQGLPASSVGPLATLCWLHHGLAVDDRRKALQGADTAPLGHLARLGPVWWAHPELGAGWSCWQSG